MTTITLGKTKVKYKRIKNRRQFGGADNAIINNVLQAAVDTHYILENDDDTETIMVDAIFMHDLCAAYIALYGKALDEHLILTGNPKGSNTIN